MFQQPHGDWVAAGQSIPPQVGPVGPFP
jgi:hypothetical protein